MPSPAFVAKDVRNQVVSREQARAAYGVVLTDELEVDQAATEAAREQR